MFLRIVNIIIYLAYMDFVSIFCVVLYFYTSCRFISMTPDRVGATSDNEVRDILEARYTVSYVSFVCNMYVAYVMRI